MLETQITFSNFFPADSSFLSSKPDKTLVDNNKKDIEEVFQKFLDIAKILFRKLNISLEPELFIKKNKNLYSIKNKNDLSIFISDLEKNKRKKIELYLYTDTNQNRLAFVKALLRADPQNWQLLNDIAIPLNSSDNVSGIFSSGLKRHSFVIVSKNISLPIVFIIKSLQSNDKKITSKKIVRTSFLASHDTIFTEAIQCLFCQGALTNKKIKIENLLSLDLEKIQKTLLSFREEDLFNFFQDPGTKKEIEEQIKIFQDFLFEAHNTLLTFGYNIDEELKKIPQNTFTIKNWDQNNFLTIKKEDFFSWVETAQRIKEFFESETNNTQNIRFFRTDEFKILKNQFRFINNNETVNFFHLNKWNTSDIWALDITRKKEIEEKISTTSSLEDLNELLLNFFDQKILTGISLKKIPLQSQAKIEIHNLSKIPPQVKIDSNTDSHSSILVGGKNSYKNSATGQIYIFDDDKKKKMKIEFRFDKKNFENKRLNMEVITYGLTTKTQYRLGKIKFSSFIDYLEKYKKDILTEGTKDFFQSFLNNSDLILSKPLLQFLYYAFKDLTSNFSPAALELKGLESFIQKIYSSGEKIKNMFEKEFEQLKSLDSFSSQISKNENHRIIPERPDTLEKFYQDLFEVFLSKYQEYENFDLAFQKFQQWFTVIILFTQIALKLFENSEWQNFIHELFSLCTAQTELNSVFLIVYPS